MRACLCVRGGEEKAADREQWSEAISSLYFLDTQKAGFVCGSFLSPPPAPRQGNRGGIIASEVQKYRVAI